MEQAEYGGELMLQSEAVAPSSALALPAAPEAVQKWLRKEDWEALTKAWQEAEAQAIAWAEGSDGEDALDLIEASQSSMVFSSPSRSLPQLKTRRRRPKWDEDFHLMGNDHRKPQPLRRYFDRIPGENTLPQGLRGYGHRSPVATTFELSPSLKTRKPWIPTHQQTVSVDNDALHPHLRHYFDRRGLEASYRDRPEVNKVTKRLRCRTPQRPSTRERILKFRASASEPSLGSPVSEEPSSMPWGTRCQLLGTANYKVKPKRVNGVEQQIPWVHDHHVSVASDNETLNPMVRHYFDVDGIESSFRNRGMHYGRPHRTIFGEMPGPRPQGSSSSEASSAGWNSIRSSIVGRLSLSSLIDSSTPGGIPGVRPSAPGSFRPGEVKPASDAGSKAISDAGSKRISDVGSNVAGSKPISAVASNAGGSKPPSDVGSNAAGKDGAASVGAAASAGEELSGRSAPIEQSDGEPDGGPLELYP